MRKQSAAGRFMKKLVVTTFLIFTLFASSCTKQDTVLNMIQAPHGQIVGTAETGYKLIIEEPNDTVVWFADRPIRKAGHIHIGDFLRDWDEGRNSFKKDPPNAVIIINTSKPIVVELILVDWDTHQATFRLRHLNGSEIPTKSGPVNIFIDSNFRSVSGR